MPKLGPHKEYRLNANFVEKAPPGRHTDGGGLYLVVDKSGARRWMLRLVIRGTGRRREFGLGSTKLVSLAEARKRALEYRILASQGTDPVLDREWRRSEAMTFEKAAEAYHKEFVLQHGRNGKHKQQWINTLRTYAYKVIGHKNVNDITPKHIAAILSPEWNTKRVTMSRVKQRMKVVFDWVITNEYREAENPVTFVKIPTKRIRAKKFGSLDFSELPELMSELRKRKSIGAYALRFTILNAVRSSNVRFMEWEEIGGRFDRKPEPNILDWVIPADKMKVELEDPFWIGLGEESIDILLELSTRSPRSRFVFASPSNPDKPISDATMRKQLQEFHPDATVHGMRRSFRNWCAANVPREIPREAIEWVLMHANPNKTEERYLDETFYNHRRYLVPIWGRWLSHPENDDYKSIHREYYQATFGQYE